jgi:hypothetical protein
MRTSVALLVLAIAGDAAADRAHFGWLGGTETLEARAVEIQTRIFERNDLGDTRIRETSLWSGIQIGITDRLELTLPAELSRFSAVGLEDDFALRRYGAQVRYRFVDRKSSVVPVVRFELDRDVIRRDVVHAELDGTVSYVRGRMFAAATVGITAEGSRGGLFLIIRPGAGVSYEVANHLRLGGEIHAELDRESDDLSWIVAGPSIAWTHGRFWLAATYGIGFQNISSAPRLVWGAAF